MTLSCQSIMCISES